MVSRFWFPGIGTLALDRPARRAADRGHGSYQPGFLADERELDPRLNQASRRAIQQEHAANANVLSFYAGRLERIALHGDLGDSPSLNRPISQLLRERLPVTLQLMAIGVVWRMGPLALRWHCRRWRCAGRAGSAASRVRSSRSSCACPPPPWRCWSSTSAVRSGACWSWWSAPGLEYVRNLLDAAYAQPHILTARAKGLGGARILMRVMCCLRSRPS